jgi:hypothetical protein
MLLCNRGQWYRDHPPPQTPQRMHFANVSWAACAENAWTTCSFCIANNSTALFRNTSHTSTLPDPIKVSTSISQIALLYWQPLACQSACGWREDRLNPGLEWSPPSLLLGCQQSALTQSPVDNRSMPIGHQPSVAGLFVLG